MQSLSRIKSLLDGAGLSPRHALGQNFLIDHNLLARLVDEAAPSPNEIVLEVGPGTGALTHLLVRRAAHVVACELDPGLADVLERLRPELDPAPSVPASSGLARPSPAHGSRLTLVRGDCLSRSRTLNPEIVAALRGAARALRSGASVSPGLGVEEEGGDEPAFMLIANLPYAAATPLIVTLLLHHAACVRMAVTIQREVADRLLAAPGSEAFGSISVVAQAGARIRRVAELPPACFWPRPKVESSMVVLDPLAPAERKSADLADLLEFAKSLFSRRRKQIGSAFPKGVALPAGILPTQRPESLTIPQFESLRVAVRAGAGALKG